MGSDGTWQDALVVAIRASSTKYRLEQLKGLRESLRHEKIAEGQHPVVMEYLFSTYPSYQDRASRVEVQTCLKTLFAVSPATWEQFVRRLKAESAKTSLAPTNVLVLVEWCALALQLASLSHELWNKHKNDLVDASALLLEVQMGQTSRSSLKRTALVVARRALRYLFRSSATSSTAVNDVVQHLAEKNSLGNKAAVFLGIVVGVIVRLKPLKEAKQINGNTRDTPLERLRNLRGLYYAFWTREVLGSKVVIPSHVANAFEEFFTNIATIAEISKEIVPSLEKGLLRAPEVVLNDLVTPMVYATPKDFDFSSILADKLMKPLVSNLKSTNATIRAGAATSFSSLLTRSHNTEILSKIFRELLSPMISTKGSSIEQRVLHAQILSSVDVEPKLSHMICESLSGTIAKEQNETALSAEALCLSHHLPSLLVNHSEGLEKLSEVLIKGLGDKRSSIQHLWALQTGAVIAKCFRSEDSGSAAVQNYVESVLPKLLDMHKDAVANPLPASQSGTVVASYILLYFHDYLKDLLNGSSSKTTLTKANLITGSLSHGDKMSFLLNPKAFSKVTDHDDLIWLVRALFGCSKSIISDIDDKSITSAWTQACLYVLLKRSVSPAINREAAKSLRQIYLAARGPVSQLFVTGLWQWLRDTEEETKDSAAAAAGPDGLKSAYQVVNEICIPPTPAEAESTEVKEALQAQLLSMLVLCRPKLLPNTHWISLCLRCQQDPGNLVSLSSDTALGEINTVLFPNDGRGQPSNNVTQGACDAFADLAFVAPTIIIPKLMQQLTEDMNDEALAKFSPTDFAIARTPEGTAYVDVLSTKGPNDAAIKGRHDYDLMKWEEEVRTQLAKKKGQQKKLTADEKARVDAQLAKESATRKNVLQLERRIRRGVGTVRALATGPPTDADQWIGQSISSLLKLLKAGVTLLLGKEVSDTYLSCARLMSPRLGTLNEFVGIATIRSVGAKSSLDEAFQQEPLGLQVTRILYRLRLAGEQRPFDSVSLAYMIPLIFSVLEQNGVGFSDSEDADEQVTLGLEFLASHMDAFANPNLPRIDMFNMLIEAMQKYTLHYKLIKDCILDICRATGPSILPEELSALLLGAIVPQVSVRGSVLLGVREYMDLTFLDFSNEIWLACHDDDDENRVIAEAIWVENALEAAGEDAFKLLPYLNSDDKALRRATARSLAACVALANEVFGGILEALENNYKSLAAPRKPERDAYGMVKKTDLRDPWEGRSGVALAVKELASLWPKNSILPFISFLIDENALDDRNGIVRDEMIEGAVTLIRKHGSKKLEELMSMFEKPLEASGRDTGLSDSMNEAIVILYGSLGQHLKSGDPRIRKVVNRLLTTLGTPSETVQFAVSDCLPPLIRTSVEHTGEYIKELLDQLLNSKQYATRRGAAYGLAGVVKGKGLLALKEFRIMVSLRSAAENKKEQNHRQGAQFAFELLSLILGRTFEPYVTQIVPLLISGFGDTSADVREACFDAAKTCFANLSSYGVKVILPMLLDGLQETQWRSKRGACELLGAMAYLDPQQLAQSLPDIIPPLTNVLSDSHKEVRTAANRSLQRFGEVITNPEIKSQVSILLKALSDPTKYTDDAMEALIKVSFVHYLDAPSLALVVRILERGLGDRSATKRKAAQIIGSLAHLTDRKDITAHLPILVAGLRSAVIDPVPTTRATASKALGSLVEKLGEDALPDLIPSLMATLRSDAGAADRLGSAQALSEVLAGLGTGRLEETLPTILQNVSSNKPTVREGFMSLFIFLPACFGNSFASYLNRIIPPILAGLADDVESIRETSLRAGRLLVKNFATKAIDLLLPELDRGLADNNHRIRLSSVELVGDLLFNLTGISGQEEEQAEDELAAVAEAGHSLLEVLGEEKRNKILSSLYICRNDTSGLVRSAAIAVWKALVSTPRTLKELVPTLTQALIKRLASTNTEQRIIAGNSLSELIKKAGEGVLATLLPTLEDGLQTSNTDNKQGICIALREIISSATVDTLEAYEKTLISVVRAALVDPDDEVRETAAEAFDSLQHIFGKKAVDQVMPHLLSLLRTEHEAETALAALLTLLTDNARANIILPNLIPTLLTPPITAFNARAIASLAEVAGSTLWRRLPAILNALMDSIISCNDEALRPELVASFHSIMLSLDEYDGLNTAMSVMFAFMKNDDEQKRAMAASCLAKFFTSSQIDFHRYSQDYIRVLLLAFDDRDMQVVKAAWSALSELMKKLRKEEMETLVPSTRQIVQQVGVAGHDLPGFCLPKGINAVLPIFLQGLMNGTAEQRTQSALAISDIVDRTSPDALKPFVTNITGPLIRVVSERSVDLKAAILLTLNNLLEKIPLFLKPFMPQLQRTFAKSLADSSSELLRSRAAKALGTLLTLKPRVDPLIAELVTGSKTQDAGVQNAMIKALYEVVSKAGETMSETSRNSILGLIDSDTDESKNDSMAITNARLLGVLVKVLPEDDAIPLIKQRALPHRPTYNSVLSLNSILLECPDVLLAAFDTEAPTLIGQGIGHKIPAIADNFILAAGKYLLHLGNEVTHEHSSAIFESLAAAISPGSPVDGRRLSLVVVRTISRRQQSIVRPHLPRLTPPIFASLRDMVIPVKLAAEAAFLAMFDVVESESTIFDKYMTTAGVDLPAAQKRSMQDYFKRVALRLAAQARERAEAEGGQGGLGLSKDEREDEAELWSVGRVELGDVFSND